MLFLAVVVGWFVAAPGPRIGAQIEAPADLIRLDVIVTDANGTPVRGLTRDDFDVMAGATRLPIDGFQESVFQPDDDPSAELPADLPRAIGTNVHVEAPRLVIVVIDDAGVAAGDVTMVRQRVRELIEAIDRDVPVGLAFSSGAPGVELTLDRARLLAVAGRLERRPMAIGGDALLAVLARTAERLWTPERYRRALLWVGAGVSADATFDEAFHGTSGDRLRAATREGGVAVYTMRAAGPSSPVGGTGLEAIVRATGGVGFGAAAPADIAAALQSDLEHQYLLSVPREAAARAGVTGAGVTGTEAAGVEVDVVVRRDDLTVRMRPGYTGVAGPLAPPALPDADALEAVPDAVAPAAGVPLSVFAAPFPTGDRDVPVLVTIQMTVPLAPLQAIDPLLADEVDWTIVAVDLDSGRVARRRQRDGTQALRPRGTDPARHDEVQYELAAWIDLPPGRHQLRVAAASVALERGGTVLLSLDVPDFSAAPVSVGGIVLGHPRAAGAEDAVVTGALLGPELRQRMGGSAGAVGVRGAAEMRVPVQPVFHRDFERWDELTVFFEIGRRQRDGDPTATIDVLDAAGRVVHSSAPEVGGRGETPVRIVLPLNTFQPGAYRLRARVASGAEGAALATGEAGFVVRGVPSPLPAAPAPLETAPVPASLPPASVPPAAVSVPDEPPTSLRLRPDGFDLGDATAESAGEPAQLARQGWDRYGQGDVEGAQALLRRAVDLGGEDPWIQYALGLAEFGLLRYREAAAAWEFVRNREPDHAPVYFDLTDAYLSLDRPDDAIAVLRDAAARWPDDPEVHNATGVVHFGRRQYDEAIAAFERAVAAAPGDGLGHFNLGQVYQARMMRWRSNRNVQVRSATQALADRDRDLAIAAYQRALALGGSFDWDARDALRVLGGG